ncbi:MAG: hypothetical protein IT318_16165 [Anaerolineales bacterium]|nr:hypothetical protein [Anaerolineales bacterium]
MLAVPVRCWAVSATALDAMEQTVLELAGAGVGQVSDLQALLGIPDTMATMVERTVRQLRTRGLVAETGKLTQEGEKVVQAAEPPKEYQAGWLLFDQVRGKMFPFVHLGRPRFFASRDIDAYDPLRLTARVDLPSTEMLRRESSLAVAAHNRRSALLELADDEGQALERERELDLPVEASSHPNHLEDVEVLARDLVEEHHLLIEVIGQLPPGSNEVALRSFSPFSPWEQQQYAQVLAALNDPAVRARLDDFNALVRQRARGDLAVFGLSEANWRETLIRQVVEQLGPRPMLPEAVLSDLLTCEQYYQWAEHSGDEAVSLGRGNSVNPWGILLETTLERIAKAIGTRPIPSGWRGFALNKSTALVWYRELVKAANRPPPWQHLPPLIENALPKCDKKGLPATLGQLRSISSRDEIAKILLAVLSAPPGDLPPEVARIAAAIDRDSGWLERLDYVAEWRNDAAHGGEDVNQLAPDEYEAVLRRVRANVYGFLRDVYAE